MGNYDSWKATEPDPGREAGDTPALLVVICAVCGAAGTTGYRSRLPLLGMICTACATSEAAIDARTAAAQAWLTSEGWDR